MAAHEWTLTTGHTGRERQVSMIVYDTAAGVRRAASRWAHANGDTETRWHSGVLGATHGIYTDEPLACIVRIAADATLEVVAHEMTHAAQHLYGLDCMDTTDEHFTAANETFAWLCSQLVTVAWETLTQATGHERAA